MIIRTKIDWLQNKEVSKEELELIQAKKDVLGDDYDPSEHEKDEEYEETKKNAIIDLVNDKIFIELEEDKVCIIKLLDATYSYNEQGAMERIEERLYIDSTLDEIEQQLNKK